MTTAQPAARPEPLAPVPPAPIVRAVIRPMTKVLNPAFVRLAGGRHSGMAAQIHHVGRRSGRHYVTPVGAKLAGADVIVVPLTFGNQSDWARNVRAAGSCEVRLGGMTYHGVRPEVLPLAEVGEQVRAVYSPFTRMAFRMLGIQQVMRLHVAE
jgi:deazaflavin-dependent oxidoreductase (nitroreductase family)